LSIVLKTKLDSSLLLLSVENLAYQKDSFVNSRRQYKRHTRRRHQNRARDADAAAASDEASRRRLTAMDDANNAVESASIHSCTVLDNFYVETPVWMVDLGKKVTVSGVVIVTWPGNPNGIYVC